MALITLTKLWINLAETGESVAAQSNSRTANRSSEGDVRQYAGGRQRAVTTVGLQGKYAFTLVRISFAQLRKLEEWVGQTVCVRDNRGNKFFGVYFSVPWEEPDREPDEYNCTISLEEVTFVEGG